MAISRYAPELPLPPYAYVPGKRYPHPVTHPQGHSFGVASREQDVDATFRYAVDLFNHGYYWEAHEAWESLWIAAGRRGAQADFLKGLIKLAAACVKGREGRAEGVARHARRCRELLVSLPADSTWPVDVVQVSAIAQRLADSPESVVNQSEEAVVRVIDELLEVVARFSA